MPMENKSEICRALLPVLQMTRNLSDLVSLEYKKHGNGYEEVIATFADGAKKSANVTIDSGATMIRDILEQMV